ncbi:MULTISPECIES: hypothetical protein [Pseudomonas chlororaphis group]|uniref:hypothetical protein n=1 Tax=Pseudomonas chlororaphis group TaxID=136842 RepID=UPI002097F80F|nr:MULTISPECIES: hypothetical protein [Pseudomonas chlororaphis group]MCO7580392.1 hypothetical protein [Pseudomonas protegens]MCO7586491.1 hypothetical protein [Pseudomonas chlororaphis]MCO7603524.1 hypothetical protein [Pseudomonas chlororaphis]
MSQQQLSSPLSYVEAIRANDESAVVIGEGLEADADRLFVAKRWAGARDLYSTLEINGSARREKLAHCVLSCGETPSLELMGHGIDEASINGLYLHLYCLGVAVRVGAAITPQMQEALLSIYSKAKTSDLSRETLIITRKKCSAMKRIEREFVTLLSCLWYRNFPFMFDGPSYSNRRIHLGLVVR